MTSVYFDNNATSTPFQEVIDVIVHSMKTLYANPFTQYKIGKEAYKKMEESRHNIKKMLGVPKKDFLIFTASATVSNNIIVRGRVALLSSKHIKPHIIISSIEHSSIYKTCLSLQKSGDCSLSIIQTNNQGDIDLNELINEVKKHLHHLALVSIILANNETGVIQDLDAICKICKNCFLHIDATQYIGKYPINISGYSSIDSLTFGAHKFNGPRIGALYIKDIKQIKNVCCTGGKSEYGVYSGTPNIAYIIGMEKALSMNLKNFKKNKKKVGGLRDYLENSLLKTFPDIKINSGSSERLYNTLSVVLPIHGGSDQLVRFLDKKNIYVNIGSACNHNTKSRILGSIGLTKKERGSALRISLSCFNTRKECDIFLSALQQFIKNKKF